MSGTRIWVDGCFDFAHHGHAGAVLQAKQLGDYLVVGVHSDEEILHHKGPPVMSLDERVCAVQACRWVDEVVPRAPYVTEFAVMDKYACQFVVHGDDITTDVHGNDCYAAVKNAGRFKEVRRTRDISTTDLVQRMLCSDFSHWLASDAILHDRYLTVLKSYASDSTGLHPFASVLYFDDNNAVRVLFNPQPHGSVQYVAGAFDLFNKQHIDALKAIKDKVPHKRVVVGLYSDQTAHKVLDHNLPVMNMYERALCVLQCRYVDALLLNAPRDRPSLPFDTCEYPSFPEISSQSLVERVLHQRSAFEDRQKRKGVKSTHERLLARP